MRTRTTQIATRIGFQYAQIVKNSAKPKIKYNGKLSKKLIQDKDNIKYAKQQGRTCHCRKRCF